VGEQQEPSSSPDTAPGGSANPLKIGEAVASELSRVLSAYTDQIEKALQAALGQLTEQWQSAFEVYANEYTKQWQEAVQALAAQQSATAVDSNAAKERKKPREAE
jgi:hypothetical protein